jgi:xanthine dehydrogenase YagR molybdenum-binding subunit
MKKGLGCAISTWGSGGGRTRASCTIHPDGSVEMNTGTQDIGTGTRTIVAIVTAEILGLEIEDITVNIGNSDYPYSGSSGGSTTIPSVCPAVRVTAGLALEALFEQIAPQLEVVADQLEARVGAIGVIGNPGRSWSWSEACRILGSQPISVDGQWERGLSSSGVNGAQFAAVTVDTETGVVTVDKVSAFHDCGLVIDELTAESQVNGGIIGGLSYALFEERIMDRPTGRMVNPDFEMYHVAGPSDMPEFDVHMMDVPERGVLGLGEPPTIPTAAAIANAVANAIGVRVHSLPITPEKVLGALHEGPEATLPTTRFDLLDAAIAAAAEGSDDQ